MHTTLLRRGSALLAGLALAAGVLGVATPARAASFSVSLTASDTTVVECEGVNLVGKVSPRPASHTIRVQQLMVGQTTWTTVATLSTTSAGNYRTTVRPDGPVFVLAVFPLAFVSGGLLALSAFAFAFAFAC